jgi:phospholipid transport system substrate-binding protein
MKRVWSGMIVGGLLGSVLVGGYFRASPAGEPLELIRQTVEAVLAVLRNPALQGPEHTAERRAKLRQAVGQRFGFADMAQRALGPHWWQRTPAERQEFVTLFGDLLEDTYIAKIERSTGEQHVRYTRETIDQDGYAAVDTDIVSPRGLHVEMDYRLLRRDGTWYVYDVVIDGSSLVNDYRTQFNAIILRESYAALVKGLKLKHAQEQAIAPPTG